MRKITVAKTIKSMLVAILLCVTTVTVYADQTRKADVVLVGAGIMSATLGVVLEELQPDWSMVMVERLDGVAEESSNGWNNAGTGHSALAELNYTPERPDGSIDISKAVEINEWFQTSRQFWAHQVQRGVLKNPHSFINSTPHMSFVWGEDNVRYLKKRYEALKASPLFSGMLYSEDHEQIRKWVPLMMEGRDPAQKLAATWSPLGTDVNFGELTRQYVAYLQGRPNFQLALSNEVRDLKRNEDGTWRVTYASTRGGGEKTHVDAKFVFIGAGGGAIHLLQKSGIPEGKDYAAFPVGGSFLVTENPAVVKQHLAKAYGKASVGSPPMSVPHLDTRVLDGKQILLFGPFATFSTKFLKQGSYMDLLASATFHNVRPMVDVGIEEFDLVQYLAGQLMQSDEDRFNALREYFPQAKEADWRLWQAGQRVQIIKRDKDGGGVLKLGTEIVASKDGTIAALLGASPGASTAPPIMLTMLETVFRKQMATPEWQKKVRAMVPSYGTHLNDDPEKVRQAWANTSQVLQLWPPPEVSVGKPAGKPPTTAPGTPGQKNQPAPRKDPDLAI
ncbi:malate dehydrogenase (quinone) [Cupriavidus sp. AU9028]|nr:malate dehydrogenase (quinone) [Cupriavidus sp. AU9028]MBY4897052.1 malate dehydrogenase (quinone) [Cupriavidus sp. AU9028]